MTRQLNVCRVTKDVILQDACREDGQDILSLIRQVRTDHSVDGGPEALDDDLVDVERSYFAARGWFGLLIKDNHIIGTCGILAIDERTCELRKMYLLREYQGQGLGRALMEAALKKAKDLGFQEVVLESNSSLKRARALYEKAGFAECAPHHLTEKCDYTMRKVL